jgi:RNA polymerase sigma-70 factor (ECF subfamily)
VSACSGSEVRRWLFHAAYCRAASSLRRRRLIAWEPLDTAGEWSLPADAALVSFEDRIAEQDAVGAALARLTPDDAACLLLTIVHGFSAAEAGAILNASPQGVAKRTSRAKRRLLDVYLTQHAHHEKGVAK